MAPLRSVVSRGGTSRGGRKAEMRRCTEVLRDLVLGYRGRIEEELRGSGVTLPQLRMLKIIGGQREVSAATIARLCHLTPQTLQSMLTRAAREGWIVRGTSNRNQRFVTATLTHEGEALVQQGMALAGQIEAEIWHGVLLADLKGMRCTLEAGLSNLVDRSEVQAGD